MPGALVAVGVAVLAGLIGLIALAVRRAIRKFDEALGTIGR